MELSCSSDLVGIRPRDSGEEEEGLCCWNCSGRTGLMVQKVASGGGTGTTRGMYAGKSGKRRHWFGFSTTCNSEFQHSRCDLCFTIALLSRETFVRDPLLPGASLSTLDGSGTALVCRRRRSRMWRISKLFPPRAHTAAGHHKPTNHQH